MANNTGIVYGSVLNSKDGSGIAGAQVSLNWVQRAEGGPLQIGGDDTLASFVPNATTTKSGKYIIPFFWASEQVPGDMASALAMQFYSDNSYTSFGNLHGRVNVTLDVRRLIGIAAPPFPASGASAAGIFLKFWQAADPELKGTGILTRFIGSLKLSAVELQGVVIPIDWSWP